VVIFLFILTGFSSCAPKNINKVSADNFKSAEVIYHVFQRSFYDSNGDQTGDLKGLQQKLDYLQGLGVTSILLLPLYESVYYHNYYTNDFYKIDPEFGSMEDYLSLVKDIHRRGMKVYMDMETQYVTEDHEWYKSALNNLQSPYSDYLLFKDSAHSLPETFVFNLTGWTGYDGIYKKITTVNLNNKKVLNYNIDLFTFWVDPNKDGKFDDGIDGFRFDHMMDHLDEKPQLTRLFNNFWIPLISQLKK
jgi:glycosidase